MKKIVFVVGAVAALVGKGAEVVKVSDFGFDAADSTRFIQAAIDSGASKVVLDRKPSPWIATPLKGRSNLALVLEPGVVLEAKRGSFEDPNDVLLLFGNADDVSVSGYGATIRMWRADYLKPPYKRGEWRHALSFIGCRRVTVEGVRIEEAGGDGIYLGARGRNPGACIDVTVRDVVCDGSVRQGISVISAENLLVERTKLLNTRGLPPEAGIDFEPNQVWQRFVNCVVRDCEMSGNKGDGVVVSIQHLGPRSIPVGIRLENCRMTGNEMGLRLLENAAVDGGPVRGGSLSLENCLLAESRHSGVSLIQNYDDCVKVRFSRCRLEGNCTKSPWLPDVSFMSRTRLDDPPGGVDFGDLRIVQPVAREWAWYCDAGWNSKPVTTIAGEVTVASPEGERKVKLDDAWRRKFAPPRKAGPVHEPFDPATAVVTDLEEGKMTKLQPVTLRGKADFVFYAASPGKVDFRGRVVNLRKRANPPTQISARALAGEWTASARLPEDGAFSLEVPAAGFYALNVKLLPRQTFTLAACSAPVAIALADDNSQSLFKRGCALHFAVPPGGKFALHAAGQGFAERVGVTLFGPDGACAGADPKVLVWTRFEPASPAPGLWRAVFAKPSEGSLEDYCVDLTGVPALLFPSDRRYWISRR